MSRLHPYDVRCVCFACQRRTIKKQKRSQRKQLEQRVDRMGNDEKLVAFQFLFGMALETIDREFLERFKEAVDYAREK